MLLRNLPKLPEIEPPKTDDAPFEDSVWQKNALTVVSARVELEREQMGIGGVRREHLRDSHCSDLTLRHRCLGCGSEEECGEESDDAYRARKDFPASCLP